MSTLLHDIRIGARKSLRSPGMTAISIVTLALGIGLTTMMFSIVDAAILRGLPFENGERLVHVSRNNPSKDVEQMGVTLHDLRDWQEQQRAFEGLAGMSTGTVNISGTERAERYDGAFISPNAFGLLRQQPLLGRTLQEGDDDLGAPRVILLGHSLWKNRYASDPGIVGRTIRANGEEMTVVGVMPEGFRFPFAQDVWIPLADSTALLQRGEGRSVDVFGVLKEGVSVDDANVQLNTIASRLALEYPETNEGVGAAVIPFIEDFIGDEPRALLLTMLGAVFLVLLIACSNVANLLLSQVALRIKEVGIRSALGAGRGRIVLQFLAEPLALAAVGALLGLGVAYLGVTAFQRAIADTNPPYWLDFSLNGRVLLFTMAVTLFATLVSGLLPAIRASGANINEVLKDESRGASSFRGSRLTKGLVVLEIALSCGLLVGAGLMIKSVSKLRNVDFGFPTEDVFTARVGLPEAEYPDDASRLRFFEELEERLAAAPGVRAAGLTNGLPGLYSPRNRTEVEGGSYATEQDYPWAHEISVAPGLFATFDTEVLQGRDFGAQDREGSVPVAIVNHSFAERHLNGEALGKRVRLGGLDTEQPWRTVVGVVPDMFADGVENEEPEAIYTPLAQNGTLRFMSIAARSDGDPLGLTATIRDEVAAIDADIPLYFVRTLQESIDLNTWFYRVFGSIFMLFGFVALFLAAIGLYGVMAFSVSRRTREMGVRMALGAQARDVVRLILRQGLAQLGIGLGLGLALAAGVSSLLATVLFDVQPRDPAIFASIALVLTGTGLLASWIPALRATRVDPVEALRSE